MNCLAWISGHTVIHLDVTKHQLINTIANCTYEANSSYTPALAGRKRLRGKTPVAQVESRVKPASSDTQPRAVPGSGAACGGAALAGRKKFRGKTPVAQVESSVKPASSDTQPPAVPGSGAAGGGGK